jgi:DNA-binding PadR family transcriptional regulator
MAQRRVDNLLAVVVLAELTGRPMHRYELGSVLREHGKERDTNVKLSSLYRVVENLERHGLVEAVGVTRNGARPESTVYRTTEAGRAEMVDWLEELLSSPRLERPPFVAALSVMMTLPPDQVIDLLSVRLTRLEKLIDDQRTELEEMKVQVSRLFLTEDEFGLAMLEAEARWVAALREELVDGSHPDLAEWRAWHVSGALSPGAHPSAPESFKE